MIQYLRRRRAARPSAYHELFHSTGEAPRPAYFDEHLANTLKAALGGLSGSEGVDLEWLLRSIGELR